MTPDHVLGLLNGSQAMDFLLVGLIILFMVIALNGIKIVLRSHEYGIGQVGKYTRTLRAGLNDIIPAINRVVVKVSVLERPLEPQRFHSITDLARSPNTKLIILPTDETKSLGGLASLLEVMKPK